MGPGEVWWLHPRMLVTVQVSRGHLVDGFCSMLLALLRPHTPGPPGWQKELVGGQ